MSGLNAFLKQNKPVKENVKYAASKDFVDEKGEPILWEIRPIKSREAQSLRSDCTTISGNGKKVSVDSAKFNCLLATKCTVYPNLNDKELQDSYGVMCAEDLIQEMLDNDGVYQAYCQKVSEVCGYIKNEVELVEEAKN